MSSMAAANYPIQLEVEPAAPQSRLTVFFRIFMLIPHLIILYFISIAQQVVTVIAWFAILFTGKYPAGMLGFAQGTLRWQTRVDAYGRLLTGAYAAFSLDTEEEYAIRLRVADQLEGRNRLTTFFRLILAIPHFIVLYFLGIAALIVTVISWFAALFTGQVPDGLHNFLGGVSRWNARLNGYRMLFVDEYPPFGFD